MKEEITKESKEEINVLDEGINLDDTAIIRLMCCGTALAPFR